MRPATTFTQGLDHTRALYFTITVFSTVGFGDITPATDPARLVVSAQMILDLILIGGVVRILVGAAKVAGERAHPNPTTPRLDAQDVPTGGFCHWSIVLAGSTSPLAGCAPW